MSDPTSNAPALFGIRHHGPGSARALVHALNELKPDIVLIEGPPEANDIALLAGHPEMEPPVALLMYRADDSARGAYLPFATFSPEWQTLVYAAQHEIPARFFDLPYSMRFARSREEADEIPSGMPTQAPFELLARAAGFTDHERWWNHVMEQRRDPTDFFPAILKLMTALRASVESDQPPSDVVTFNDMREAYMRNEIRRAQAEGYMRIAIVCGAWHTPGLRELDNAAADAALLADLDTVEIATTWVPWTYGRLAMQTGYGAGISAPGWYRHLWQSGQAGQSTTEMGVTWLTRIARLLRAEGLDTPPAQVIDAVRLAHSLAALRESPLPSLPEYREAVQSIICFGDDMPMRLIERKLIVGERMGQVPSDTPRAPIERDLTRLQRELQLFPNPESEVLSLDIRDDRDRARSQLLHRLILLGIPWGTLQHNGAVFGTYSEYWSLRWQPQFARNLIDAGMWGTTVEEAATARAIKRADEIATLSDLTRLLDEVILSELPRALEQLISKLGEIAAVKSDVAHMMDALLPLARVLRYGSIRAIDNGLIRRVVSELVARICVGLPHVCHEKEENAALEMAARLSSVHNVIKILPQQDDLERWYQTLEQVCDDVQAHPAIHGRICRLLLNDRRWPRVAVAQRMRLALSGGGPNYPPEHAVAWLEGFLRGSGLLLIHDDEIWYLLDSWLTELPEAQFVALLPALRRTFSDYSDAERRQIGERVAHGGQAGLARQTSTAYEPARAHALLQTLAQLHGLATNGGHPDVEVLHD